MLRNDASQFRARRSRSGAPQRLNAPSFVAALRRRRLTDALAVATTVAAFIGGSLGDSNVYAQRSSTAPNAQSSAQRGGATPKTPLFSGKFARNVSEKFSRAPETSPQTASRRYASTPERAANGRPNPLGAPASNAARVPAAQRSFAAPNRAAAPGYNASTSNVSRSPSVSASADALAQPSTSRESAQEALAKIPWNALSPAAREKLAALAKNPTIYRRLPMAGGYCNPELFDFFLTHPHAVVGLWRQMGYDDVAMAPIGPNLYSVREKTGTVGRAQILYQDNELTLIYCNGKYQGPVVPRSLDGEMFLLLQTRYTEDPSGRPIVVCRLDAFVDLKNPGADLLARTFSGALGKLADANFEQTLAFIDNVSQTAETNPGALTASIAGLSELSPEARRLFAAKTSEIARQAQLRARGTYVDYQLTPKLNNPSPTVARILSRERAGGGVADAALAARSRAGVAVASPTVDARNYATPPAGFNAGAASANAASSFADSSSRRSVPTFNSFDKPSLERNSFALSDDADADYDFESELDWEEEAPLKVGGARVAAKPLSAPTLVPETSVAKATARPATRFSDALALVDSNENAGVAAPSASDALATDGVLFTDDAPLTDVALATDDAPLTDVALATDDALLADDETTSEDALPLLIDFENELLQAAEATDANVEQDDVASSVAKPAPLAAFPAASAADAVALPSLPAASNDAATNESNDAASTLPVLVFADASNADAPNAPTAEETTTLDDVPLLLLPDAETANAVPTVAPPKKAAPQPAAPKVALKTDLTPPKARGRVVAPIVPSAKKSTPAQPSPTPVAPTPIAKPSPTPTPAPVWRAVEPKPAPAKVAPPIAETARVETEKGATFRKPEIH